MFFFLSKLLDLAVDPLWWGLSLLLAGLLLRRRRAGPGLLVASLSVLVFFSLPPVSNRLWASLEAGAVDTSRPDVTYDAVVLLGGVVSSMGSSADTPSWNDNTERLLAVRELLLSGRAKVAIVSGGHLPDLPKSEAEYDVEELVRLGVPADRLVVEGKANNTRENATLSKPLLEQLGAREVLIVTSAFHLPRALGCFHAVGLQVDALPVDYRLRDPSRDSRWAPRAGYLDTSADALREWLGRAVYRVLGYAT